jgi:hypothetical protein
MGLLNREKSFLAASVRFKRDSPPFHPDRHKNRIQKRRVARCGKRLTFWKKVIINL